MCVCVCVLLTGMGCATTLFWPHPWGPGEGPNGQILNIIKFQLQNQIQRFLNQTLFVYSQMKDLKQTRFSFVQLGHAPGVGLVGTVRGWGVKKKSKFNQSWCVIYLHEAHLGLGEGPKGQISLNLNYKLNFKGF